LGFQFSFNIVVIDVCTTYYATIVYGSSAKQFSQVFSGYISTAARWVVPGLTVLSNLNTGVE
jgi:hypothetical protein